jgi:hypothetical protein
MAAQDSVRHVRGMLDGEHEPLAKKLTQAQEEAKETSPCKRTSPATTGHTPQLDSLVVEWPGRSHAAPIA